MIASWKLKFLVIWFTCILLYAAGGFLTYGYVEVHRAPVRQDASLAGAFWPFYWFGRGWLSVARASENLFKEAPPMKVEK